MPTVKRSPLAPKGFPVVNDVDGVRVAVAQTGMKYKDRPDLLLVTFDKGTQVAGVYTRSKCPSAPIDWCKSALAKSGGYGRALLVNAGNANAFTGQLGLDAVNATVDALSTLVGCRPCEILLASTGVIGEPMDAGVICGALPKMIERPQPSDWKIAAGAILTTDTFEKAASKTVMIDQQPITITGIAKGSGMIAPDMATMLGFVFTDADIPAALLTSTLKHVCDRTFNSITVDSDTSTSDTVLLYATGKRKFETAINSHEDPRLAVFASAVESVCRDLAQQIIRDGEGATKFISITVTGAEDDSAARRTALSIANSPLVKTAIAGEDANWGRIVMAVGKSGEAADRDALKIAIGGQAVASKGQVLASYDEALATQHMQGDDIVIEVDTGVGKGSSTVWTCDLTHGYISINADYRS